MVFRKYIPGAPLDQHVDCMVYVEGNNKGVGFPKIAMSLVFNLHDSFKLYNDSQFTRHIDYKKYWAAGIQTQPTYVESYGESKMIVVQFKTLGAYIFLNQPLRHFTNQYINLVDVFSWEAEHIWERLQESNTIREKFEITENFLFQRLINSKMPNEKLLASLGSLFNHQTPPSIQDICLQHRISRKHLSFLFQEYMGIAPKMLSSLNRFQGILQALSRSRPDKLGTLAYELDFFDQAHFNNNFKRFTGIKPNEYVKNLESIPSLRLIPHFLPVS